MTDDAEWHEWRRGGIGGSDIAALLGLSSFATPYTVWADKMGFLPPTPASQRQRIGLRMETVLADEFAEETGLVVVGEQTWVEYPPEPVLRCTTDGFVSEWPFTASPRQDGRWWADVAIGCWQAKTDGRFGWPEGIPPGILAQCQWEMMCCELTAGWLTVMFAGFKIVHYPLELDEADAGFMRARALAFWRDHVLTGEPPTADGSDVTRKAIAAVNPLHEGERVDLDHVAHLVVQHGIAATAKRNAELAYKEIGNQLRVEMGTAETAMVDGVDVLTLHEQSKTSTCEHCGHTSTGEPFRVLRHVKSK